jgi:hypothetical protein
MHNTSHTRIKHKECYENLTLLQLEFQVRLQVFEQEIENKKHFAEVGTLDDQE